MIMNLDQLLKHKAELIAARTQAEKDFMVRDGALQFINILIAEEEAAQKAQSLPIVGAEQAGADGAG